jgi:hypothetical protein
VALILAQCGLVPNIPVADPGLERRAYGAIGLAPIWKRLGGREARRTSHHTFIGPSPPPFGWPMPRVAGSIAKVPRFPFASFVSLTFLILLLILYAIFGFGYPSSRFETETRTTRDTRAARLVEALHKSREIGKASPRARPGRENRQCDTWLELPKPLPIKKS